MRLPASVFALMVALAPASAQAPDGGVVIRISYTTQMDRLRPDPRSELRVEQAMTVVLSADRTVSESWDLASGGASGTGSTTRQLGGTVGAVEWRVGGEDKLVRRRDYPQNTTTITVTVRPDNTCEASVAYELKPGFSEFTLPRLGNPGGMGFYANPRTISTTCQIE